ncbi:pre-toxin TG domain-containing protein [Streptococcus oralis]|uniref:pre-toxin TG domain-containing protein n=1 Tax=Streptococcus oralis TaxID=1303 RepID=UPI00200097BA|nr:pre-toxin TG domain-containing protein [Streptococcus oralis]
MTKDVELHSSTWKTMKQALTGLTENATVSSSGYGNYTNAQAGSYSTGTTSTGFAKRVEDLVKISEKVQKLIKEKDTDGVVSYTYHDETSTAQTLQAKLSTLERYAENVNTYINKKIDRPFYEAMDKVGAKLEALNIQKYKTTNKIGYKRIESVKDPYGHPVGTKEVTPPEIGIDELYKVDSPYKASLKKSYEEYKKSKDYKDSRLTETEYVQVMHQTRSFEYVSIDDEKSTTEMWRDLTLTAATVVLYVFCPPAGAVLSTVVAAAEMYSAASGKDWGTGRELDGNERVMRGAFALLDLIPAGKYLGGLAKIGKTAGITAVKTSIKTAVKEGLEQGVRNLDSFKGILKNAKGLGDNVLSQIKTYGKQLDNLRPSKILSNSADALSDGLRHADNVLSEAAQNFRLNIGLEPQLADGILSSGGGKLSHLADNLSAFAKNLGGSVEDFSENTVKFFEKPLSTIDRFNEIDIVSYAETMKKNYTEIDVAKLTDLTTHNTESKTALLGYFQPNSVTSYEQVAHANGWTYFDAGSNGWNAMWKVDPDLAYKVNDEFLLKQIQEGKNFILSSNPETADFVFHTTGKGESFMNEMNILRENGYKFENFGNMWRAYK